MPINNNESIIAVPITLDQPGQVRQFLLHLVEKLDIVLGYRGDDPYVTISQLQGVQSSANNGLTRLEQTVLDIITNLFEENDEVVTILLEGLNETLLEQIELLKSSSTVSNNDTGTQVISNPPTQAEVQAIQDQVSANASDFNDLLTALRDTGIIAT